MNWIHLLNLNPPVPTLPDCPHRCDHGTLSNEHGDETDGAECPHCS